MGLICFGFRFPNGARALSFSRSFHTAMTASLGIELSTHDANKKYTLCRTLKLLRGLEDEGSLHTIFQCCTCLARKSPLPGDIRASSQSPFNFEGCEPHECLAAATNNPVDCCRSLSVQARRIAAAASELFYSWDDSKSCKTPELLRLGPWRIRRNADSPTYI